MIAGVAITAWPIADSVISRVAIKPAVKRVRARVRRARVDVRVLSVLSAAGTRVRVMSSRAVK